MINTTEMEVTPKQAAFWLERNDINRELKPVRVNRFARAMMNGEWMINGETIKLSESGRLLDGQHRLHAILETGLSMLLMVQTGLDEKCFVTIDQGNSRSSADVMYIDKIQNSKDASVAARLLYFWEKYGRPTNINIKFYPSTIELIDLYKRHPSLKEDIRWAINKKKALRGICSVSIASFLRYIFRADTGSIGEDFMEKLTEGLNLSANNPVYLLRQMLLQDALNRSKMKSHAKLTLIFKAYKKFKNGESVTLLRHPAKGTPEMLRIFDL